MQIEYSSEEYNVCKIKSILGKHYLTSSGHKKHIKAHVEGPKRETHPCDSCGEQFPLIYVHVQNTSVKTFVEAQR